MDSNQRFDQLESLLVDLARKVDQQSEAIARQGEAITRQGEAIAKQGGAIASLSEAIGRIEQRVNNIDDQIGDIITIFKLSEARHTQAEQRLETLATEVQEQGRRTDEAIQIQMQMLALMRAGNNKTEALEQRFALLESQEPRIKRLEDEVFRAAS
jgi:CII-binding regulator of phage lambda lysogenization HflD